MIVLDPRFIRLIEDIIQSHSIKDKYSTILEFAIENDCIDKEQIKELLSFTKNLVDEKILIGRDSQKKRMYFSSQMIVSDDKKIEIPDMPIKTKKYTRVELFNDNKNNNQVCMSCGEVITGEWIFKHHVDGQYQCWHPNNECIPIKRLSEFISRPKYKQFLKEQNK